MAESLAPHLVPLVERVHARLRPGRVLRPAPQVAFYPYVDTRSTVRYDRGRMAFRLSDHLVDAPEPVLEGVVSVLITRLLGLPIHRADPAAVAAYHAHVRDERFERRREESRRARGRKHVDPVGAYRSLIESFLRVSLDLGVAPPQVPTLSWSKTVSRRRFGHWDAAHGCIVISRVLDDPRVPEFVLDFVVYHEILHIIHPVENGPGRRRIHTAAFLRDEKRFPRREEAEAWLTRLASRRARAR